MSPNGVTVPRADDHGLTQDDDAEKSTVLGTGDSTRRRVRNSAKAKEAKELVSALQAKIDSLEIEAHQRMEIMGELRLLHKRCRNVSSGGSE